MSFQTASRSRWFVRLIAILIFVMGLVNITSGLFPALHSRTVWLSSFFSLDFQYGGRLTTIVMGFFLLLMVSNLLKGKRVAWWLTEVLLVISAIANLVKGFDYEEALVALFLAILLLRHKNSFQAESDRPTLKRVPFLAGRAFLVLVVYGLVGFFLLNSRSGRTFDISRAVYETLNIVTFFFDPQAIPMSHRGQLFVDSLLLLAVGWYSYVLWLLLSPVLPGNAASHADRSLAAGLVDRFGKNQLAQFALFPDKQYYFSPGGSVVAYVVKTGVALALGDPIGPSEDRKSAIEHFVFMCSKNDWVPVFYQVSKKRLPLYHELQLKAVEIGQEAIVNLVQFTLQGSQVKNIRNSFNKLKTEGFTTELLKPPLSEYLLSTLDQISDQWLDTVGGREMKFSMGWFNAAYVRSSLVMVAKDPAGQIVAFATLLESNQGRDIAIDLMRYRENVPNGLMDFMFVSMLIWAKEHNYYHFNLGLSALSGLGESESVHPIEKALHVIYQKVSLVYNFQGLHAFKQKFHPDWEPRYLIYQKTSQLPQVALSLIRAHSLG